MGLRGPRWFLGRCLEEERSKTRFARLSSRALDLGLRRTENTSGHVFQACGAVQKFLANRKAFRTAIRAAPPQRPHRLPEAERSAWVGFIRNKRGTYGPKSFGYNYTVLRGYLTSRYGGRRTGGGGGNNELEICFRLLAEFMR